MEKHAKRVSVCGTAPSWRETPWEDTSLEIWGLNDAYSLGLPRFTRWFDTHALGRMWFKPPEQKVVYAEQVPAGYYVRPAGHLEWLKTQAQTKPVYLKDTPPADWPAHARRFPIERIAEAFNAEYWASGPAYMLALAILEGFTEIHVYGIHLSTEAEYREQRPNWEFLLGRFLGRKYTLTTTETTRVYDGENGMRLVLPKSCPILTHGWRYGYDPKPQPHAYELELQTVRQQRAQVIEQLATAPRWKSKAGKLDLLQRLRAKEQDLTMRLQMRHLVTEQGAR